MKKATGAQTHSQALGGIMSVAAVAQGVLTGDLERMSMLQSVFDSSM